MAGRILDRRKLRRDADSAAEPEAVTPAPGKGTATAAPKARKSRARKVPQRMRARWAVFDGGMKQVAVFDYNDRAAADGKLAELAARNKGSHFVQIIKEPMPEPGAEEAPPRAAGRARATKK